MDDTVRDPEQVKRAFRTDVVGSLPEVKPWRRQLPTVNPAQPANRSGAANGANGHHALGTYEEAIKTLRNSILLADFERQLRTLLVTSASPSEGKSTIAIHLAVAHAQQHRRTLLIDGDLRRPSVHKRFNVRNTRGLSDVLAGEISWAEALAAVAGIPNLDVLTAGATAPRRAADLIGRGLEEVVEEASSRYDLIVVDAPPLLGFAEPLQMATVVDGVLVVARAGETSRRAVASVLSTLSRLRANVLGIVLNEVTRKVSGSYYYYGYYRQYYGNENSLTAG